MPRKRNLSIPTRIVPCSLHQRYPKPCGSGPRRRTPANLARASPCAKPSNHARCWPTVARWNAPLPMAIQRQHERRVPTFRQRCPNAPRTQSHPAREVPPLKQRNPLLAVTGRAEHRPLVSPTPARVEEERPRSVPDRKWPTQPTTSQRETEAKRTPRPTLPPTELSLRRYPSLHPDQVQLPRGVHPARRPPMARTTAEVAAASCRRQIPRPSAALPKRQRARLHNGPRPDPKPSPTRPLASRPAQVWLDRCSPSTRQKRKEARPVTRAAPRTYAKD